MVHCGIPLTLHFPGSLVGDPDRELGDPKCEWRIGDDLLDRVQVLINGHRFREPATDDR